MHATIGWDSVRGEGGVTWRILGLTACPAGEINYYLLRSLGLNGGNDVHHAQTEGSTETDGDGQPVATDFRRLIENEGATFAAGQPLWPRTRSPTHSSLSLSVFLRPQWTLFNGNRFTLCGLRIVLENITHKQERNPPDGHARHAVREGRGRRVAGRLS